ncbi:hypothetical protein VULLAG_LOCUS10707 [Vulpes lagopus]
MPGPGASVLLQTCFSKRPHLCQLARPREKFCANVHLYQKNLRGSTHYTLSSCGLENTNPILRYWCGKK